MRQFLKYIALLFLGIFVILGILDIIYTSIFRNESARNKTQFVLSLNNQKIDYVFLGSSRVENSIISSEIEKTTSKNTLNLGTQGAIINDMNLYLRLLIKNEIKISKLFVQIDYVFNSDKNSNIVYSQALPYLRSNEVIKEYAERKDSKFKLNYYIPFYRYLVNDYRIGFREVFASLIKKKSKINFEDGFVPIFGKMKKNEFSVLPKIIIKENRGFNEIDSICMVNEIDVVYFVSPFCKNAKNLSYLKKIKEKIPELNDFSALVQEDKYFKNCAHLNEKGALLFTKKMIEELDL